MELIINHLTHKYNKDTLTEVKALDDVNLVIKKGEFIGLIGHTGSGKSTLIQHLNGLLKPDEGSVYYEGEDIFEKGYDIKALRGKIGMVFQYPEHQLFSDTVFEDVCFGPLNMGVSKRDTELRAYEALKMVGMDDDYFYQSPFDLSGGQKRRAAIAGVLAMKPEILILDEPTAGLDPKGRDELLDQIKQLQADHGMTIILVSHSMEDVARYVSRLIVMDNGKVIMDDEPQQVFMKKEELNKIGLRAPEVTYLFDDLRNAGFCIKSNPITIDESVEAIMDLININRVGE